MWPFRCISPDCQSSGEAHNTFYLPVRSAEHAIKAEDPTIACPVCLSKRYVYRVENIHLIIHDPDGPIPGSNFGPFRGIAANRFSPACERGKLMLVNLGGRWPEWFRFTTLPDAITCFECAQYLKGCKVPGVAKGGLFLPLETADRQD